MEQIYIGVDIAKSWLDIHHPTRGARRIENAPADVRSFVKACAREGVWVVFEASGGYDRLLREALEEAGVRFSRVNPRQARDFARTMGVIGKTDEVDARMLMELGQRLKPGPTAPLPAARQSFWRRSRGGASSSRCASRKQRASSKPPIPRRGPISAASSLFSIAESRRASDG